MKVSFAAVVAAATLFTASHIEAGTITTEIFGAANGGDAFTLATGNSNDPDSVLPNSPNFDSGNAYRVAGNPIGGGVSSFVGNIIATPNGFSGIDNLGGAVGSVIGNDLVFFANDGVSIGLTFAANDGVEPSTLPTGFIPGSFAEGDILNVSLDLLDTVGGTANDGDSVEVSIAFDTDPGTFISLFTFDGSNVNSDAGGVESVSSGDIVLGAEADGATGFVIGAVLTNGAAGTNQSGFDNLVVTQTTVVPEPTAVALAMIGLVGAASRRRRV